MVLLPDVLPNVDISPDVTSQRVDHKRRQYTYEGVDGVGVGIEHSSDSDFSQRGAAAGAGAVRLVRFHDRQFAHRYQRRHAQQPDREDEDRDEHFQQGDAAAVVDSEE